MELYSKYWDAKLKTVNNSILSLISINNDAYNSICTQSGTLETETNRSILYNRLNDIVLMHSKEVIAFCYVPEQNIYIKSSNNLSDYDNRRLLDEGIKQYIDGSDIRNNGIWSLVDISGGYYFLLVYHMNNGYAGAIVGCDYILDDLALDDANIGYAAFVSTDDSVAYQGGGSGEVTNKDFFSHTMSLTEMKMSFTISENNLYKDKLLLLGITTAIFIIGIFAVCLVTRIQNRIVLKPLSELRGAMIRFSQGDMEVRIDKTARSDEIQTLYQTFNEMAREISNLKIDVYESTVQNLKIQSSYLQVQIQPHFYTNILNLINGLTQVGETESIREITTVTARYFRYLLSSKNTLVPLDQELDCVRNYIKIQSIRYKDYLAYEEQITADRMARMVPPLVVQTFVENSIIHNVTMVPKLTVQVDVMEDGKNLTIRVTDNGLGFRQDIMEKLNRDVDISENGNHIGIVNIKQRLRMIYGKGSRVTIECRQGRTVITVFLPISGEELLP